MIDKTTFYLLIACIVVIAIYLFALSFVCISQELKINKLERKIYENEYWE